jgi:hypothetical protein
LVGVFRPDGSNITRLVKRAKKGATVLVEVVTDLAAIKVKFSTQTKKWDVETIGEEKWERQHDNLISTFITAKEILSHELLNKTQVEEFINRRRLLD